MSFVWLDARKDGSDAVIERDAAIIERDAATDAKLATDAQLRTAQDELADARDALASASDVSDGSDVPTPEEVEELRNEIEELSVEVERLADENETLAADLVEAQEAVEDAEVPPDETSTSSTDVPGDTIAVAPVSATEIGDQISGLFRPSVLGRGQKACLGQAVLDDLGEQRVVDAIAAESPDDDEEFVQAIRDAAAFCGIDRSAVFG